MKKSLRYIGALLIVSSFIYGVSCYTSARADLSASISISNDSHNTLIKIHTSKPIEAIQGKTTQDYFKVTNNMANDITVLGILSENGIDIALTGPHNTVAQGATMDIPLSITTNKNTHLGAKDTSFIISWNNGNADINVKSMIIVKNAKTAIKEVSQKVREVEVAVPVDPMPIDITSSEDSYDTTSPSGISQPMDETAIIDNSTNTDDKAN